MIKFNEIAPDYEPRSKIFPKLPQLPAAVGMTEAESAFLCGMLKKYRPKKIVELGVAAGGSTAIILQCLEDIGQKYVMHSIDAGQKFYADKTKDTGCIIDYIKENNIIPPPPRTELCGSHTMHRRTIFSLIKDEIGDEIDFVVLDVAHIVPCETLEFLAILPYLSKNAIIVMHDVAYCLQSFPEFRGSYAAGALFSAVVADKFINFTPDNVDLIYTYPNIGAFQVGEKTWENIENVFLTLMLCWKYWPNRQHLRAYYEIYEKNYSPECCKIFEQAMRMNFLNLRITREAKKMAQETK